MDSAPHVSLSPTQEAPSQPESSSPGTYVTYPPIRAPPSFDFDTEKASNTNEDKAVGSSSSSSSVVSSSEIEEGFMSGEEEFETASERPFVADPDEETLEFESAMPKARVSGEDSVLGGEEGEEEDELSAVNEPTDYSAFEDAMEVEDENLFEPVKSPGDGVLESERKEEPLLEKNLSLDYQGDMLPESSKLGDEASMSRDNDVVEEKSEVLADYHIAELNSGGGNGLVVDDKELIEAEENGVSDVKEGGLPAEETAVLSGGSTEASAAVEAPVDANFVKVNKDDSLVIEEKSADEMKGEAGGLKELEENQVSESNALGRLVEGTGSFGSVSVEAPDTTTEEPVESRTAVEEPVDTNSVKGSEDDNLKIEESSADEMKEQNMSGIEAGGFKEPEENQVSESNTLGLSVEGSESFVIGSDEATDTTEESVESKLDKEIIDVPKAEENGDTEHLSSPELQSEQQNDLGAKLYEPKPALAGTSNVTDGPDEAGIENSGTNTDNLNSVQNEDEEQDKMQFAAAESSDHSLAAVNDGPEVRDEVEDHVNPSAEYKEEYEGPISDEENEGLIFEGSETAKQIMMELAQGSGVNSHSDAESYRDHSQGIDGQIIMESDDEMDTDEEEEGKELFDSAALTALLKAATSAGSEGGSVTITSPDGSRLFSAERPAGLGSSIRSLRPAPRPNRSNLFTPSDLTDGRGSDDKLTDEEKKKLEIIQLIRVKFLRLISRVGHSPEEPIAAQVLYRLVLASGRHTSQAFSIEAAKTTAMQLEAESADGKNELDFSLNILVLGKTGVGKSATINSIFGQEKAIVDPFEPATASVREIIGTVDGVKIRVFDTPGLRSSVMEQAFNQRILSSVKKLTNKFPPDILLYVDRLDTQTRDLNDLPLLRSITSTLGSSIWRSAIVTLTHGASAPPDGPSGSPLSYEVFVAQRSHIVQQSIGQAVGDLRMMNPSLMNPVSLVENHPSCRRNRDGQRILPNGQSWRSQLLLLCYSLKILSEASSLSKPQDPFDHRKLFGFRVRSPPLPYLLSSLLQSRAHPKLPTDQGDNVDSDIELEDLSDSDQEEEDEYDLLPPFKPLRKSQITKLSKDQRKAYFDEYDYRVKLLQKKQWKEELRRMREMKKRGKSGADSPNFMSEDADPENGGPAAVPVPLPDMALPPSFDGDNPAYRYRFLEPTSQLLARPVLDTHGWDHDCGYDGVSLEENLAIVGRFPAGVAVQITKDKKEFNIHLDSSVAVKHGENGSSLAGFDIQTIGKQLAYIVKGETKFKNLKKNKTAGGISITFLGENVVTGLKIEDQIAIGKRLMLVGSTGTVRSQGDVAYGANLEARLKEDYPIGQDQATLGLSLMRWRGDLALGANLQSQFSIGRSSKMSLRIGLNNKLSGQITVRTSSSEQLQLALVGVLPIAMAIYRSIFPTSSESYSAY